MLHTRRVHPRSNLLGPRVHLPKVTRAQEIDIQRHLLLPTLQRGHVVGIIFAASTPLHLLGGVLDLLGHVLALHDLVEVLDADVAAGGGGAGRVVGPDRGADAPALAVPEPLHAVVEVEAAEQYGFAARFAEERDSGLREPLLQVGVVVFEDVAELLVGAFAGAFALEADDEGFGGVLVEEGADVGVEVAELFGARQADGEDGVNEDELVGGGVVGVWDLDAQIEEADAVLELLEGRDSLAADGGWGFVVRGCVVGSGDAEGAHGRVVREVCHPGVEVGGAVQGDEGAVWKVDAGEAVFGVGGEGFEGGGFCRRDGTVHAVLATEIGLEG